MAWGVAVGTLVNQESAKSSSGEVPASKLSVLPQIPRAGSRPIGKCSWCQRCIRHLANQSLTSGELVTSYEQGCSKPAAPARCPHRCKGSNKCLDVPRNCWEAANQFLAFVGARVDKARAEGRQLRPQELENIRVMGARLSVLFVEGDRKVKNIWGSQTSAEAARLEATRRQAEVSAYQAGHSLPFWAEEEPLALDFSGLAPDEQDENEALPSSSE